MTLCYGDFNILLGVLSIFYYDPMLFSSYESLGYGLAENSSLLDDYFISVKISLLGVALTSKWLEAFNY